MSTTAPSSVTAAHMAAQKRLRELITNAIGAMWADMQTHHKKDVGPWLANALPITHGAQEHSASLTVAAVARTFAVPPFAIDMGKVTGSAVRAGANMSEVYSRPFFETWHELSQGAPLDAALASGQAKAESTAATDLALSSRAAFSEAEVSPATPTIIGYRRVANAGACNFCQEVDGAFCLSADASPLHSGCSCTLEPVENIPRDATIMSTPPAGGEIGATF